MKVLVIGGAGYIGSHVVKEMMKAGQIYITQEDTFTDIIIESKIAA